LAWAPLVLAAHPTFAASNPAELIALARTQQVDFSSPGTGSLHHLAGEYINYLQSTKLVQVPYRGAGPAVADAVSGQVKLTISGMPPVVQFLQTGTLKAIAVTSKNRAPLFLNIPAMSEIAGFEGFDFTIWYGLLARAGTPQIILSQMAKAAVASLKDDRVREILTNQSAMPVGNTQPNSATLSARNHRNMRRSWNSLASQ
jgi:tripartite-type tricarboxylate transporter receptor subunit TctC